MASLCSARLGVAHVSTGEVFRQAIARGSLLGRRVRRYVSGGRLVPDALVVEVMAARLRGAVLARGFVLDGFPRTEGQAIGLDAVLRERGTPLEGAVYLTSPLSVLIRRLSGRLVCRKCGANYHIRTMPPKEAGRCDRCRGGLVTRKDDRAATIRKRLAIDRRAGRPLLTHYQRQRLLHRLNGAGYIETVFRRALRLFRQQGWLNRDRSV